MDEFSLSRRRALQLSGVVGVGALAGCLGGSDSEIPSYAQYLAPTDEDAVTVFYTVLEESEGEDNDSEGSDSGNQTAEPQDPLLSSALSPALAVGFFAGFTLGPTGLDALLGPDAGFGFVGGGSGVSGNESDGETGGNESGSGEEFESEVDELFLVGDTLVMAGSIDTDEVDELLGETSTGFFGLVPLRYEQSGEVGNHTLYAPELAADEVDGNVTAGGDGENDNSPVALGDEEVLVGPEEEIERILDAKTGERERASDAFAEFEWLLETAGTGDAAFASFGADGLPDDSEDDNESDTDAGIGGEPDDTDVGGPGTGGGNESGDQIEESLQELSQEPLGAATSGVFDASTEEVDAEFAAVFEAELTEDDRTIFEEEFGTEAEEVSVEFDGNRVSITGTYSEESVGE